MRICRKTVSKQLNKSKNKDPKYKKDAKETRVTSEVEEGRAHSVLKRCTFLYIKTHKNYYFHS